jgi:hypothetical protein
MVNLSLDDNIAAALRAKAAAVGLTVEAYLAAIVLSDAPQSAAEMSEDEFDRFLDEEATSGPSPAGTFSRAELYSDHD